MAVNKQTITITFGEQVENSYRDKKIGKIRDNGYTVRELRDIQAKFNNDGYIAELIELNKLLPDDAAAEEAAVLLIRNGIHAFMGDNKDDLMDEQVNLEWNKKWLWYGSVKNRSARYALVYAEHDIEPDYEHGISRVISFNRLPLLTKVREGLPKYFGDKAANLLAEGNNYYDVNKCYIGYHGDFERKIVLAIRLGSDLPLRYMWYLGGEAKGDKCELVLSNGDMYLMSEKATGWDSRKRKIYVLKHSAGLEKNIKIKKKGKAVRTSMYNVDFDNKKIATMVSRYGSAL